MPSPLGHALGGAAVGLMTGRFGPISWRIPVALGFVACLPDLDLIAGQHSGMTHSIGFAALAGIVTYLGSRSRRYALAAAAAYGSHVLFDYFGLDTAPPLGVMALWPFDAGFYMSPWTPLPPVSRRYWLPGFWTHTMKVAIFEAMFFGGLLAVAWWQSRGRSRE
jgi:membrane-bound metal-dependent hydrolase YbcI (DUF457 family)